MALLVFAGLAAEVASNGHIAAVLDPAVTHWLAVRRTAALTAAMVGLTELHSTAGIDVMLAFAALLLGPVRKRWAEALWLVVAVESSMLLNVALKLLVARHRPDLDDPLVHLGTFSFPSGHALASTVFWACIWLLLPSRAARMAAGAGLAVLVALVCLSRVYLGAHFFTDVVAGVSEGLACAAAWSLALPALLRMQAAGESGGVSRDGR